MLGMWHSCMWPASSFNQVLRYLGVGRRWYFHWILLMWDVGTHFSGGKKTYFKSKQESRWKQMRKCAHVFFALKTWTVGRLIQDVWMTWSWVFPLFSFLEGWPAFCYRPRELKTVIGGEKSQDEMCQRADANVSFLDHYLLSCWLVFILIVWFWFVF